jgi:AcrR family transcriptional regulator
MTRIRTAPRKEPAQQRSRATVDAIVDATARVLVRDGYDALSTNRVAQEGRSTSTSPERRRWSRR